MKEYIEVLRNLFKGENAEFSGKTVYTRWIGGLDQPEVPIYIAAEGPKTLELAGEIADGIFCGMGISPDVAKLTLKYIGKGAERAGRSLDEIDLWGLARVNMGECWRDLVSEIRMELTSTAHHAFRFT